MSAGMRMPAAPRPPGGGKPPKVDAKKASDQAKKQAANRAKAKTKRYIKLALFILIPLIIAGIAALVYFVYFGPEPGPEVTVDAALKAAFLEDEEKFKAHFTEESVEDLETAWSRSDEGSWKKMMKEVLTDDKLQPKVVSQKVSEDGLRAIVMVDTGRFERPIPLRLVDEEWKIDVRARRQPNMVVPDDEISAEMAAQLSDDPENEMWWEDREVEEAAEEEGGGCLGCRVASRRGPSPGGTALIAGAVLAAGVMRRRVSGLEQRVKPRG